MLKYLFFPLHYFSFSQSADALMKESNCVLDHPAASHFRHHVLDGEWNKAETDLNELQPLLADPSSVMVSIVSYYPMFSTILI